MKIPVCVKCKHFNKELSFTPVFKCLAFPEKIPDSIFEGRNKHTKPLPNQDNDITFEERKD